jgi:hypothetical protein
MMTRLDGKITAIAEQILKRPLTDEEELEIFRISDAVGMRDVQSFLHLLLVFKLHEQTMKDKFDEIAELEKKIRDTLESSILKVLRDGTERIGAEVGKDIAANASGILSSFKEFHVIRGCIVAASVTGIVSTLAYWLGASGAFKMEEIGGPLENVLLLPAGWWMLFCFAAYTYFWCFEHWVKVKKSVFYKGLLALQGVIMAILLISMLRAV